MLLKAGNQVKIKNKKNENYSEASILGVDENRFSLVLLSDLKLYPEDEVELEISQREDAFYILNAKVLEANGNQVYNLQELAEPFRIQRRKSERIPANHKVEYLVLTENNSKKDFQEGLVLNISRTGALLTVKEPFALWSKLLILFELSLNNERAVPAALKGKVIREHTTTLESIREWKYSYGIEFDKPFTVLTR